MNEMPELDLCTTIKDSADQMQIKINDLVGALEAIIEECPHPKLPYACAVVDIAKQAIANAKEKEK